MWWNGSGNHTWVEVWDDGWHFLGAAEPDPRGLDRAWFTEMAAQADEHDTEHAIYAASFQKTGLNFPLVWATDVDWVSAINVTARYTEQAAKLQTNQVRLEIKVVDASTGARLAVPVEVFCATNFCERFSGISRNESADLNNLLSFNLPVSGVYKICAGKNQEHTQTITLNGSTNVLINLRQQPDLAATDVAKLKAAATDFFTAKPEKQVHWTFSRRLEKLLLQNEPAVRQVVWEAFKSAPIHAVAKQDFEQRRVSFGGYTSPFTIKYVGTRPANGWGLFIALHGGGNAPKELNDEQWGEMQHYYRDHPESGGYIYLALRAPNDTWNGFYDDYVYPLIANLIHECVLFANVDPNKVFLIGYSHGGYGAFAIGPKEPDLFAAIHASAAAPTDGETAAENLRNTPFTCMLGGLDTMYGRRWRDEKFRDEIQNLRGQRDDIYPVRVTIVEGNGHTGLPDRDMIAQMLPAVRDPVPRELSWRLTDKVITDFFWLRVNAPGKGEKITATIKENSIMINTTNITTASLLLDDRLVDLTQPVTINLNGQILHPQTLPSLRTLCETMARRCDYGLAFSVEYLLPLNCPKNSGNTLN